LHEIYVVYRKESKLEETRVLVALVLLGTTSPVHIQLALQAHREKNSERGTDGRWGGGGGQEGGETAAKKGIGLFQYMLLQRRLVRTA
jgi:hypothetical protein